MKSLFLRLLLLVLTVYQFNAQFVRYNGHYYAFYNLQARLDTAVETCWGMELLSDEEAASMNTTDQEFTGFPSYPVVLNDEDEQTEIYQFYQQESRVQNSFVWIGGQVRVDEDRITECEQRPGKPAGYNCSDTLLLSFADGSFSTHTAWDPSNAGVNISGGAAAAWSKQSNTWLLVTENDGPHVNELICEYNTPTHCNHPDIDCVAHGVCLQQTAYTERACVCEEGFTGTDCAETAATEASTEGNATETSTEGTAAAAAAEATLVSGISNTVIYGVIAAACVLLLAGGTFAYFRMKSSSGQRAPPDVRYRSSHESAASGRSDVSG